MDTLTEWEHLEAAIEEVVTLLGMGHQVWALVDRNARAMPHVRHHLLSKLRSRGVYLRSDRHLGAGVLVDDDGEVAIKLLTLPLFSADVMLVDFRQDQSEPITVWTDRQRVPMEVAPAPLPQCCAFATPL